jgi:hypothetical protein
MPVPTFLRKSSVDPKKISHLAFLKRAKKGNMG